MRARSSANSVAWGVLALSLLAPQPSLADNTRGGAAAPSTTAPAAAPPAAPSAQGSQAAAQALFDEARKAMAQGNYGAACPKFADSEKLDPGAGTLLNLANCYEKNGQTASAWATFKDAAAEAKKSGHPDWEATARKRASALEPTLSKLTIEVPQSSVVDGLELQRDGVPMARAEWGAAIPVDPGSHVIDANAPNAHKWSTTVSVGASGATATVTVPALEIEKVVAAPPPPPVVVTEAPKKSGQRVAGIALASVGLAGIAAGSVFGVLALTKNNQALEKSNCPTSTLCNANGISLTNDARTFATVSTVGFVAGGGLLALGAVLFFSAPKNRTEGRPAAAWQWSPAVGPGSVGMSLGGNW
jgi:hypothetical protein